MTEAETLQEDERSALESWVGVAHGYVRGPWRLYRAQAWCVGIRHEDTEHLAAQGFASPGAAARWVHEVACAAVCYDPDAVPALVRETESLRSDTEAKVTAERNRCKGLVVMAAECEALAGGGGRGDAGRVSRAVARAARTIDDPAVEADERAFYAERVRRHSPDAVAYAQALVARIANPFANR